MKKKLLYVAPHLSTGGLPQYLYKKIEVLKNDYDIYVVEYSDVTGGVLIVQKNRITSLLPSQNFFTLGEDKKEIWKIIERISPDFVHIEEMPEYFMDHEIAEGIYTEDRKYKIFETSHDSSFDSRNKRFFPDKLLLVSNYQLDLLKDLGIPSTLVEYPIDFKKRPERKKALLNLGLDPEYKHVINVGLFTPRKNQAEIFEYAKNLKDRKIKFHFIGNQADNFKYYWDPLLKNLPDNCVIWGERNDVHRFYEAADLFLFTSRGSQQDKETSPLVIREAIGHQIPSLIYNLDVYQGMYDKYPNIRYLSKSGNNENLILELLEMEPLQENTGISLSDLGLNKKIQIQDEWDPSENKIIFRYLDEIKDPFLISVKDIDSGACIFSSELPGAMGGYEWWMMPLPKNVIDFNEDPTFGGFNIEFRSLSGDLIESRKKRIKQIPIRKPSMDITNTEPIFMNYEEFFVEKVYDHLDFKNLNNVIDIGASLGLWTKYILSKGAKNVYCFEPNREAIKHLKNTLKEDRNTSVFENAVYKENSTLQFFVDDSNSITSSIYSIHGHVPSYDVRAITLEEAINKTGKKKIDLIKIDIEGAEFEIIENLSKETSLKIDSFLIEYHDFIFSDGSLKLSKMEDKLKELGFYITKPINPKAKYIYASRKKSLPIWANFIPDQNKIEIHYQDQVREKYTVSVKDIDSLACIFSFVIGAGNPGTIAWAIPLPPDFYNFQNFYEFGGFSLEFYDMDQNLIETRKIRIKEIPINKPVFNISNDEPIFINYNEFFIEKVYNRLDVDNLDTVIDIGANVGLWSKYIQTRGAKKIYCFEPNKKVLKDLKNSFSDDKNVEVFDLAVSHVNGELEFFYDPSNSTTSSLLNVSNTNSSSYKVNAITLAEAIRLTGKDSIDLVKIDIEGAEFELIEKTPQEIIDKIESLIIESHSFYHVDGNTKDEKLVETLESYGFISEKILNFFYFKRKKKKYYVPREGSDEIMNLYDFSKTFSWDMYEKESQIGLQHMFNRIYFTHDYYTQGCIYERYGCLIQKNDIVVDAGANIGVFTNYAIEKGASHVYSFEPGIDAYNCLVKNKPRRSTSFNLALGNRNSVAKISYPLNNKTHTYKNGMDHLSGSIYLESEISNFVPIVSIDSLFSSGVFEKIDFLKINCVGAEKEILDGISDSNLSKIKKISLEFPGNLLSEEISSQIINRLTNMGFRSFQLFLGNGVYRIYNFWRN